MKAEEFEPVKRTTKSETAEGSQLLGLLPGDNENEHALIQLPFSVAIEGRRFEGSGLSLVSAYVTGLATPEIEGSNKIAAFRFPFDGFSISLWIDVRLELVDQTTGLYKLAFLDPTGPHLPQLRYLINAFIAGDIVSLDEMMRVPAEKKPKSAGNTATGGFSVSGFLKRLLGFGVVAAASIGMIFTISYALKERLFVHDIPALAVLEPSGLTLQAPEAGQVAFINGNAAKGQVAYSLQTVQGAVLSIENPCECSIVFSKQGTVGATVFPGTPVAFAVQPDSEPVLKVQVPDNLAKMMLEGAQAEARMPDGRMVLTSLQSVESAGAANATESMLTLKPVSGAFSNDEIGASVSLKIVNSSYRSTVDWFRQQFASAADLAGAIQLSEIFKKTSQG